MWLLCHASHNPVEKKDIRNCKNTKSPNVFSVVKESQLAQITHNRGPDLVPGDAGVAFLRHPLL